MESEKNLLSICVKIFNEVDLVELKKEGYLINEKKIRERLKNNWEEIKEFVSKYNINHIIYLEHIKSRIDTEDLVILFNESVYFRAITNSMLLENGKIVGFKKEDEDIARLIIQLVNSAMCEVNAYDFTMNLIKKGIVSYEKYKALFPNPNRYK